MLARTSPTEGLSTALAGLLIRSCAHGLAEELSDVTYHRRTASLKWPAAVFHELGSWKADPSKPKMLETYWALFTAVGSQSYSYVSVVSATALAMPLIFAVFSSVGPIDSTAGCQAFKAIMVLLCLVQFACDHSF